MKCYLSLCFACFLTLSLTTVLHADGIEAAAHAEQLIESCNNKNIISVAQCLNHNLNRKWKYELEYTGRPFYAIGRFDKVRRSLVGNLFAFMNVGKYRVACKITKKYADILDNIGEYKTVLISGVLESYNLTFDLRRFHHLRLTPYCSVEVAT
jgi:hypothetical protein